VSHSTGRVEEPAIIVHPSVPPHTVVTSARALAEQIAHRAADLLAASPDSVDPATPLRFTGMDSVLAARLRMRLKQDLDLQVPLEELLDDRPLIELAEHLRSRAARPEPVSAGRQDSMVLAH
jgi:acyl carrier protein